MQNNQFPLAHKYYQQSIAVFLQPATKQAIFIAAEVIERGREIFQKNFINDAYDLFTLGIESLYKAKQYVQAAQTARIEGERLLSSSIPEKGLEILNRAVEIFTELQDLKVNAEIFLTIGNYYIRTNQYDKALENYTKAGEVNLSIKENKAVKEIIKQMQAIAVKIINDELAITNNKKEEKTSLAQQFYDLAERFALDINDEKEHANIIYNEFKAFSQKELHEAAFVNLEKSYQAYAKLKDINKIVVVTSEVSKYGSQLIENNQLIPATKYLNLSIETLMRSGKKAEAAGICMEICETYLQLNNNEVAVSWSLRAADILTEAGLIDEGINFLEEVVDQLMAIESIENAILCYGKIAKILEENNRMDEVEETALKVMAFGTASMKNNKIQAGLRLWEVALTIGAIVGEEFTGRLCLIEGQTFYEIKNYEKSLEMFKESLMLFKRTGKTNRLNHLGNVIFNIANDLQKQQEYDFAFKLLPIAFESMTAGDEMFVAAEKLLGSAKKYIEIGKDKEGIFLINTTIDALFNKGDVAGAIEKCFIGAAMLISYGRTTQGSQLIDRGMAEIAKIDDENAIRHLATVCRNQGILLRDEGKLAASHIVLASGIGILRTINDLVGIGQISVDLGETLVQRNEMSAAVEAYRNGITLLHQGNLDKEALRIVNDLVTEGRKEIDNNNNLKGIPLIDLSGDLFILLNHPERIMVISEIFINQGGKMLNERNFEVAALYFSKAMEFAQKANLKDYLPKVGNRCIDFGLKLVKEGDSLLGIQFMNAGAEIIIEYEEKYKRAARACNTFLEAVTEVLSPNFERLVRVEEERLEIIGQYVDSAIRFFSQVEGKKTLIQLAELLNDYGKKLLKTKDPRTVRRIFEPALSAASEADSPKVKIKIANSYLDHVNYITSKNKFTDLETTINQALNIFLEVGDINEIRKFMGVMTHIGSELCINKRTQNYGQDIITTITDLTTSLEQPELYPVVIIPAMQLDLEALENEDYELVIFIRQIILRLLNSILNAGHPLSILGNINLSGTIPTWFDIARELLERQSTFDQAMKIIDQALQIAVIIQDSAAGTAIIDEVLAEIDVYVRKRYPGVELLYEILAQALAGLQITTRVTEIGNSCLTIGKEAADKKRLSEAINFLKAAGRIFATVNNNKLIGEVAISAAAIGDERIADDNYKEGLYYYSSALENYELSQDEKSITIIAKTIQDLFKRAPIEDGYVCFLVPGMVYANRNEIEKAEKLAEEAIQQTKKMIKEGKKDLIFQSIPYTFAAADIYDKLGNYIEETKFIDEIMFTYIESTGDSKIVDLFVDLLTRSINKKLLIWDFNSIYDLFEQITDQRIQKNRRFQAIKKAIASLTEGKINESLDDAKEVSILFQRNIEEYLENYRQELREDLMKLGKISIYNYKERQPISQLVNLLIQDLYARKEITGKYFQMGLYISGDSLTEFTNWLDKQLQEQGKAIIAEAPQNTTLEPEEALYVLQREYIPQKFQVQLNEDESILYSYLQLREEVKNLALGYQEIGNIDINKISEQLRFSPEIIQREIEYLILEGKINPRLVGRT
jgi:hypothetical protein